MAERARAFIVRPFLPQDTPAYVQAVAASRGTLADALPWAAGAGSEQASTAWALGRQTAWAQGQEFSFVVCDATDGTFAGCCTINRMDWPQRMANLTYWTDSRHTGRGAASAGAREVARFGFVQLGLGRVEILTDVDNRASQRVAEKIGAQREGVMRQRILLNETRRDAVLYGVVPADLAEPHPRAA